MRIIKFGGTSVGSPEALKQVEYIVGKWHNPKEIRAVVVSAFSGVTNQLIEMARLADKGNNSYQLILKSLKTRHTETIEILLPDAQKGTLLAETERLFEELTSILYGIYLVKECSARTLDLVMSFGEQLSARIVTGFLVSRGMDAHYLDARTLLRTNDHFGNAQLLKAETYAHLKNHFSKNTGIAVVTGFIAATESGETSTLGRGGSDYTASILAAGIGADEISIYTDVNGMMTADPRVVKNAFTLPQISYEEAMELSHFGAKVIYPPTLQPAIDQKIPIRICNTFDLTNPGTIIQESTGENPYLITGLSSIQHICLINVQGSGLIGVAGISGRLFSALAHDQISVILITQASSEHSISFAIASTDAQKAKQAIEKAFALELKEGNLDPVEIQPEVAIIAIIGENMKRTPGVSGKIFGALGRNGINVMATAQGSSELNISIVIAQTDVAKTLNALHQEFFAIDLKRLHLFLVGPGLIGKTLLHQLASQLKFLHRHLLLDIRLVGLANSRQMVIDPEGIDLSNWNQTLADKGEPTRLDAFTDNMVSLNLPNSIVVDCTSTDLFIPYYLTALQKSIAVVTPNKLANSASLAQYKTLRD
ncbi:MAG TPA: aspartate kinase, partial [Catalimonadaceae bacterium]|nr:aspartate kinase [Catalimonadaceae bacterium]